MTDKPSDKNDPPAAEPKRPHATLDLKATEVKPSTTVKPAESKPGPGAAGSGGSDANPAASPSTGPNARPGAAPAAPPAAASSRATDGPKSAPAPSPRGPSALTRLATHLLAGLTGGAVVLFGGERIAETLSIPTPGARLHSTTTELHRRLSALEEAPKANIAAVLESTEERLAALDKNVGALHAAHATLADETKRLAESVTSASDDAAMTSRLANLEDRLKTIASAASAGGGSAIPELAAITGRIADLDARISQEVATLREGAERDMDRRLADLDEAAKSDLAQLSQEVETLKADRMRLEQTVRAAQEETGRVASALGEVRTAIEQQGKTFAKAADVAAAVTPVAGLVSRIESDLDGVLKKDQERQSHTDRIVTALELGNLRRAIDRGDGFANELAAVRAASGGQLDLAPLEPFKATGVPSLGTLKDEARPLIAAALETSQNEPGASVWDRMLASAKSIVRVRRTDAADSDTSLEASVARIRKALDENRLQDVLAETDRLPPEAAAKLADWRSRVAARQSVDAAIAKVEGDLKAALAPAAPVPPPGGGN